VRVIGAAGHAGTTPMNMRHDAAAAAAEMVLAVESRCSRAPTLVGTVGTLAVPEGSTNVIPGRCEFSVDIRAGDDVTRDAAVADVSLALESIAARRSVSLEIERTSRVACAPCSEALSAQLAAAVERAGVHPFRLPSGAGHDAMMLARLTDVAMLFVRCGNGGVSHSPLEQLDAADADLAAQVFADFLRSLE
jgi:allantoate deiminase